MPRAPKNVEQATALLDQVARLDAEAVHINAIRDKAIADSNAVADTLLAPVVERRAAIAKLLEAWWSAEGKALLKGKRKTVELGGCKIGTKAAPLALTFGNSDDFDVALERLREARWAKPYVRVSYAVDKTATKEALTSKHGQQLRELGFGTRGGSDVFVLEAVKQAGTVG
jgi:hypothetical protein